MVVAGVDVGSVAAKSVVFDTAQNKVLAGTAIPTGWNSAEAGKQALSIVCQTAQIPMESLAAVVGTGYGRVSLPFVTKSVTEITCHARGATWLFPETGIVMDIGGQDSKVISLGPQGEVQDFIMNDKCAAGTGRFLQVLSGILDMPLEELGKAAMDGKPVPISSMCAVFAETEIVGLLATGTSPQDIAAGVYLSIVKRTCALAKRIAPHGEWTFSGGLAMSPAFCHLLSQELGAPVNVAPEPQLMGALGAALVASTLIKKQRR
jgi:predicted CoA-substrate-specific enzyme activase